MIKKIMKKMAQTTIRCSWSKGNAFKKETKGTQCEFAGSLKIT